MTTSEVIQKLKRECGRGTPRGARQRVAEETGLLYSYLSRLVYDEISEPGAQRIDRLRRRYEARR